MAYMSQEKKKEIAALLKKEFGTDAKTRGFKYTLGVRNHSTIVFTIKSGNIDFIQNYLDNTHFSQELATAYAQNPPKYIDVNTYHIEKCFAGKAKDIIERAYKCLNHNNHDRSDIMTDYFDVGHYVDINIGRWDKPYEYTG